ncbi:MAG: DUF1134 domain-containing protein [Rhizobiales bacterium]|nr:DUF1134 domain-containing protein [Hyphomicrobiales bacterium]
MPVFTWNVSTRARLALASAALVLALPFAAAAQTGGYSTGYGQPRGYDTRAPVEQPTYGGTPRYVPDYEVEDEPQGYDSGAYDQDGDDRRRPGAYSDDVGSGSRYGEPRYDGGGPRTGERLPWATAPGGSTGNTYSNGYGGYSSAPPPAPRTDYGYSYGGRGGYGAEPGLKDEPGAYRSRNEQELGGYARPRRANPYRTDDTASGYGTGNDAYPRPYDDRGRQRGYDGGDAYGAAPGPGVPYYPADQYRDPRHGRYDGYGARGHGPVPPESVPGGSYGYDDGTYDSDEIAAAGHRFFGKITTGLAKVIEYAFQRAGRPNGYILGEEAGGAFVAGLRYGEGTLYTKNAGEHVVYWQGPSIGYDFGAEGSKTMILVYNLHHPADIYNMFGGVDGSAYLVGGVGVTFQKHGHVTLAPIRSGVGVRLGANVGYLRYTRRPTWNPF